MPSIPIPLKLTVSLTFEFFDDESLAVFILTLTLILFQLSLDAPAFWLNTCEVNVIEWEPERRAWTQSSRSGWLVLNSKTSYIGVEKGVKSVFSATLKHWKVTDRGDGVAATCVTAEETVTTIAIQPKEKQPNSFKALEDFFKKHFPDKKKH